MKIIELINGRGQTMVDDDDYEYLSQWKWTLLKNCKRYYVGRKYRDDNYKLISVSMHRVIMGVTDPKVLVDHKDTNELNNQRSNLRLTDHRGNGANRLKNYNSSSKYKGVRVTKNGTFRVYIKGLCDKTFKTIDEALSFHDKMFRLKYGEFARTYEDRTIQQKENKV